MPRKAEPERTTVVLGESAPLARRLMVLLKVGPTELFRKGLDALAEKHGIAERPRPKHLADFEVYDGPGPKDAATNHAAYVARWKRA